MKDKASTFVVRILNDQFSSWQGTVTWVDKNETQGFRSALELIKMIDAVVDSNAPVQQDETPKAVIAE